jgi:hypothetical protein
MKKIFSTLLILAVMLTSTVAMAAFKETIPEDSNISSIKRLAIALPMHYRMETSEPTLAEFTQLIFDASKMARCYVISYDEIAENIQRDTGVDIKALTDTEKSRKIYNENISKYADAFVVVTTVNSSKKVTFFFEVYDSNSGNLAYYLISKSGSIGKNSKDYGKACEDFYKKFDAAVVKSLNKK